MAYAFFNPTNYFENETTGWEIQSSQESFSCQRGQSLNSCGDETKYCIYDKKTSVTCNYAIADSQTAIIPRVGSISSNGFHVDSVSVNYSAVDYVTMTINGHKHAETANGTAHATCRTYGGSIANIDTEFGCPSTITGLVIPDTAYVRSFVHNVSCTHNDVLGANGEWCASENRDGVETVSVELSDNSTITADVSHGWSINSGSYNRSNTTEESQSAEATRHFSFDQN